MKITKMTTAALIAMLAGTVSMNAQYAESNGTINQRKFNQQERIGQGVRSGELTRGETRHVEHQEHAINREERNMRAANGGHLTRSDCRVLDAQQNHMSHEIARDKHNDRVR